MYFDFFGTTEPPLTSYSAILSFYGLHVCSSPLRYPVPWICTLPYFLFINKTKILCQVLILHQAILQVGYRIQVLSYVHGQN